MKGKEGYIELFSQGRSYINEGDVQKAARIISSGISKRTM